jgi:hypothetical protein
MNGVGTVEGPTVTVDVLVTVDVAITRGLLVNVPHARMVGLTCCQHLSWGIIDVDSDTSNVNDLVELEELC